MAKTSYAIALGSNRPHGRHGGPARVVAAAVDAIAARCGLKVDRVARVRSTPALGPAGRGFANSALILASKLEPPELLAELKSVEREFGRRGGRRWGPRVLDLDIIAWDGGRWRSRTLVIPHPRLARRDFVLEPLAAIAPGWRLDGPLAARHLAHRLARRAPRD